MKNYWLYIFISFFASVQEASAMTSSILSGNWTNSATWNNSGPSCGDTIEISLGTVVTVNSQIDFYSTCGTPMYIIVEGTLDFSSGKKLSLPCGSGFLVKQGGQILTGGGGGNSNYIEICNGGVWSSNDGPVLTPISYGEPITEDIISINSGDVFVPTTWDCTCIPQFYHNVIIDTLDQVSYSGNFDVSSIIINGTLDLSSSAANMNIFGDWTNNGTFLPGNTSVIFKGSNTQQISGNNQFYNLEISNSSGVAISSGAIDLLGTLTLTNGNFNTNNGLTIISNASGTGRIAEITGGSISGNVTMQRYIDAGATNWRFISSAVNNPSIDQFNDDFETSGYPGSLYPNWPSATNPWPSVYYYDETVSGIQDSGYVAASSGTNTIAVGEGLWVWCGDTITGTQPFTLDLTGAVNTGNINLPVSYTNTGMSTDDGWNMVGNPYPSTLDWDSPNITKTNINNAIYIWNPDIEQFASYAGGFGTNGGSRYIASSQAFWVQANSSFPSIQVTESSKSATGTAFLKTTNTLPLIFNVQNNYGSDEMVINLDNNATVSFDPMYDANKLASTNPNLPYICSVLPNNTDLSINQLPAQEIIIPIKVHTGVSGLHTFTIENITEYDYLNCIFLEDVFTGTTYDLFNQQSFIAYISDTTTIARYLLHIGTRNTIDTFNPSCVDINDGLILVENNSNNGFESIITDSEGNIISNDANIYNIDSIINVSAGTYTIETIDPVCGNTTETVTITAPQPIIPDFSYTNNVLDFTFTNTSQNGVSYLWDFGDGSTSTLENPNYTYLTEGTYPVTLTVFQNDNCFSTTTQWINIITTGTETINKDFANIWIKGNSLFINTSTDKFETYQIKNSLGQIIATKNFNNNNNIIYNLSDIRSQILFITLISPYNTKTIKVVYNK